GQEDSEEAVLVVAADSEEEGQEEDKVYSHRVLDSFSKRILISNTCLQLLEWGNILNDKSGN
ncbi:hypothetical protein ACFLQ6_08250, partial [Thermoproteota archaeon]